MKLTRRSFLKLTIASGAGALLTGLGASLSPVYARTYKAAIGIATPTDAICPFCSLACPVDVYRTAARVTHIEGNLRDPATRGRLCAKGMASLYLANCPDALVGEKNMATPPEDEDSKILECWVRICDAGSDKWKRVRYKPALQALVEDIASSRDAAFDEAAMRTTSLAVLGGAQMTNEECYLASRLARALGIVYLDSEVRDSYMPAMHALQATTGWPASGNPVSDVAHSDCVLVIGANPAENQPVAMNWILDAKLDNLYNRLIVVDPRFTRTASRADIFARIRPGTDTALIGGLINYVLKNRKTHAEYVAHHTNFPMTITSNPFKGGTFSGIFQGLDKEARRYTNNGLWNYRMTPSGDPFRDVDYPDMSVMDVVKRHFKRYTRDKVCKITGLSRRVFDKLAETIAETGSSKKVMNVIFSSGVTTGPNGTAAVHALAILQMLLGNLGRSGGGLSYYHPYPNGQGAFDMGMASGFLPGHFPMPHTRESLSNYRKRIVPVAIGVRKSAKAAYKKQEVFFDNVMRAWYKGLSTSEAFKRLPREDADTDYTYAGILKAMHEGRIEGLIVLNHNPLVTCPDTEYVKEALGRLKWLAVLDAFESETAAFWKGGQAPCKVYLFPSRPFTERDGSVTATDRVVRYSRGKDLEKRNTPRDLFFIHDLACLLKDNYASGGPGAQALGDLAWPFAVTHKSYDSGMPAEGTHIYDKYLDAALVVAQEIAGYRMEGGTCKSLKGTAELGADTFCGNWLYAGLVEQPSSDSLRHLGREMRDSTRGGLHDMRGWAWPNNTRILFNKASCDKLGKPWPGLKKRIASAVTGTWNVDLDKVDGDPAVSAKLNEAFWMTREGVACAFAPAMVDYAGGPPLPEFYEPIESPFKNNLNPAPGNPLVSPETALSKLGGSSSEFKYIGVCCSVAEHFQDGSRTRNLGPLVRAVPEPFAEIGPDAARDLGIRTGDKVKVTSARGSVVLKALVTRRVQAVKVRGKSVGIIGLCDNFGLQGLAKGASACALAPLAGEPVAGAFKSKSFMCSLAKA